LRHANLRALGVGYLWLATGLMAFSMSLAAGLSTTASLHVITISALGTLSSTIILKLSSKRSQIHASVYCAVVLLIGFATISRFLASMMPLYRAILLGTAGVMWSANFIVVAYFSFFRNLEDPFSLFRCRQIQNVRIPVPRTSTRKEL
jgi:uncharacterized protein involved in response to NO